jgi:hypothetical protein
MKYILTTPSAEIMEIFVKNELKNWLYELRN